MGQRGKLPVRPQRSESRVLARPQIWSCVSSSAIQFSGEATMLVSHFVGAGRATGAGASHEGGSRARWASDLSSTSADGCVYSLGNSRSGRPAGKSSTLSAGAIVSGLVWD